MRTILAVFLLLASRSLLCAVPPAGPYAFSVSAEQAGIWDFSGEFSSAFNQHFTIDHRPNGKFLVSHFSGTNSWGEVTKLQGAGTVHRNSDSIRGLAFLKGSLHDRAGQHAARGTLTVDFTPAYQSNYVNIRIASHYHHGRTSVYITQRTTYRGSNTTSGAWTLLLNAETASDKISGDATITLGSGRQIPFIATGRYQPASDTTTLRLVSSAGGAHLRMELRGSDQAIVRCEGAVMGQRVQF